MIRDNLFVVDGYQFTKLPIVNYSPKLVIIDGQGTERMQSSGFRLFRDVETAGGFWNLTIVFGGYVQNGQDIEWRRLVDILESYSKTPFHIIRHLTGKGEAIEHQMYATSGDFNLQTVTRFDELFWKPLSLNFLSEEAWIY